MRQLGDVNILREQLVDLEYDHAKLAEEYQLLQEHGLEEPEEARSVRLYCKEHRALLEENLKEAQALLSKYHADIPENPTFDLWTESTSIEVSRSGKRQGYNARYDPDNIQTAPYKHRARRGRGKRKNKSY